MEFYLWLWRLARNYDREKSPKGRVLLCKPTLNICNYKSSEKREQEDCKGQR